MFKSDALEGLLEGDTNTEALALREEIEGLNRVCMATVCTRHEETAGPCFALYKTDVVCGVCV